MTYLLKSLFVILNVVKDLLFAMLLRPVNLRIDPSFLRMTNLFNVIYPSVYPGFYHS
jgi:hypothetical protein